jgi:hypothetical protein
MEMIKLKDLLKESSPGFANREFGDPLPTLKDIAEKHQSKKVITEDVETAVDMLMKRWKGVVAYWEDIDEIWKDNKKIPKIIVKYKKQWEKIVDKMDREVRKAAESN